MIAGPICRLPTLSCLAALWLLARPPFDVPFEEVSQWGRRHRAESSRHDAREEGREHDSTYENHGHPACRDFTETGTTGALESRGAGAPALSPT